MSENGRGAEWTNPEALEAAIGELRETEEECPGVWYVSTCGDGEQDGTEFYVVDRDTDSIPNEAKAYGAAIPDCPQYLLYPMEYENRVRKIIQYEALRYRMKNGVSDADKNELREIALDGMEERPEYFGVLPAPTETPCGHTARYKTLMNGVFWLQTDCAETALAVAYPIWDDIFSDYVMNLSQGDADGFGCLFFPETAICLAVFELRRTYRAMRDCPQIDAAALMNAICWDFPDYAVKYNLMEQTGGGAPLGEALLDANRPASPDWMISLTPEAGTNFLRF